MKRISHINSPVQGYDLFTTIVFEQIVSVWSLEHRRKYLLIMAAGFVLI